jgi:hypothetical protein
LTISTSLRMQFKAAARARLVALTIHGKALCRREKLHDRFRGDLHKRPIEPSAPVRKSAYGCER